MPLSMRKQTAGRKAAYAKRLSVKQQRQNAVKELKKKTPVPIIMKQTNISRTTLYRLRNAMWNKTPDVYRKLLDPTVHFAGRRPVLTEEEEKMIVERTIFAAERGFTYGDFELKALMAQVANDGRKGYAKIMPSDYALRSFRARNRTLTCRKTENIDTKRLLAQNPYHIKTLVEIIERLEQSMPDIFLDPNRIWNLDETSICAKFGRRYRGYNASNSRHGGYRTKLKDNGKHLTAEVMISASGHIAPLFLIAQGKKLMPSWTMPLPQDVVKNLSPEYQWMSLKNWLPDDSHICCSAKGSVTKALLPSVIEHLNNFIRKFVPKLVKVLLLLDGHSSRKGVEWLNEADKCNIEIIQLPANTSHILQPCDDRVNKVFSENVRNVLDIFLYSNQFTHANIAMKIKLAAAAFRALNSRHAIESFDRCGLWPLNKERIMSFAKYSVPSKIVKSFPETPIRVSPRVSDGIIHSRLKKIVSEEQNPTTCLRRVETLLQQNLSANSLMWRPQPVILPTKAVRARKEGGAPAQWLTEKENSCPNSERKHSGENPVQNRQVHFDQEEKRGQISRSKAMGDRGLSQTVVVTDNVNVIRWKCFDDVPIKWWRYWREKRRAAGGEAKEVERRSAAATGLLRLRHMR